MKKNNNDNMNGLIISESNNIQSKTSITNENALEFLKNIEEQTKWQTMKMIEDIRNGLAKSYSVRKENPDIEMFLFGANKEIMITIKTKNKEANLSIPR